MALSALISLFSRTAYKKYRLLTGKAQECVPSSSSEKYQRGKAVAASRREAGVFGRLLLVSVKKSASELARFRLARVSLHQAYRKNECLQVMGVPPGCRLRLPRIQRHESLPQIGIDIRLIQQPAYIILRYLIQRQTLVFAEGHVAGQACIVRCGA